MRFTDAARRRLAPCLIGLSFCGSVNAATLAEVYELAVTNDPELAAAEANYMARKEVRAQGLAGILPTVVVQGSTSSNEQTTVVPEPSVVVDFNSNSWQAVLTQPLFRMDRWFQFRQSKNIAAQALADFSAQQQELAFRVADTYLNILEAQDRLTSAKAELDAVQRQLEQVQQRFDVGLVAITDVLESTAAYDTSMVNVIEAEGAQVISFENLLRLTGRQIVEINELAQEFPIELPDPRNEDAWVDAALSNNYSLIAAQEGVKAAQRQVQIARSGHLPTVNAEISYAESSSGAGGFFGSELEQASAALRFNVPVFAGGATRSVARQAGYRLEEAQRNYDLTQKTVVENTRTLYTAITTDVARVNARLKNIESSQSALDATQTGYEVGTRNIVDVLLAQQRLYLAEFQYASARYQYIRDTLRLKQVVGTLSPEDLYALNDYISEEGTVGKTSAIVR